MWDLTSNWKKAPATLESALTVRHVPTRQQYTFPIDITLVLPTEKINMNLRIKFERARNYLMFGVPWYCRGWDKPRGRRKIYINLRRYSENLRHPDLSLILPTNNPKPENVNVGILYRALEVVKTTRGEPTAPCSQNFRRIRHVSRRISPILTDGPLYANHSAVQHVLWS